MNEKELRVRRMREIMLRIDGLSMKAIARIEGLKTPMIIHADIRNPVAVHAVLRAITALRSPRTVSSREALLARIESLAPDEPIDFGHLELRTKRSVDHINADIANSGRRPATVTKRAELRGQMPAGPSEDYLSLLRGEITSSEYVTRLKADVAARFTV